MLAGGGRVGGRLALRAAERRLMRRAMCASSQSAANRTQPPSPSAPPGANPAPPPSPPPPRVHGGYSGGTGGGTAGGGPRRSRAPASWSILGGTLAGGALLLLYANNVYNKKVEKVRTPRTFGTAKVGGPFTLVDTDNRVVTEQDFRGRFMLMYFGFTFCPDICPDELDKITAALNRLPKADHDSIVPVMVSVDPYRDTPERVKEYLRDFHPKFVGLTGDEDEVEKVAKAYRVYFSKADKTDPGEDYLVDHSIITYLMDPYGEFVEFYGKNVTEEDMAKRISAQIHKYDFDLLRRRSLEQKQAESAPAAPALQG